MAHQHRLIPLQNSTRSRWWLCDFCRRCGENIKEEFSYRCHRCNFDLCFDCIQPLQHPSHEHELQVIDVSSSWSCDICKCDKTEEKLSRRCGECNFDICGDCSKHYFSNLHQHALFRACALDFYSKSRGCWGCVNCRSKFKNPNENWPWHCHKCEYDLCDQCIGASPCKKTDAVKNIKELVIPHFCSGLTSLENFVLILDSAPLARDISVSAANRIMPGLLELAKSAHKAFYLADSAINKINSELDQDFLKVVEQEKSTADRLDQTKQSLKKLQEHLQVLQQEYNEVKQQLSKEESKLKLAQESLKERQRQLEAAEEKRRQGELIGGIVGAVILGPLGAMAGLAIADAVENPNVSNAAQAVNEMSSRVTDIKGRVKGKEKELSNLENEKEQEERKKRREGQELESLKARKQQIKESQRRLAILNESIKSCTTLVNLTTARAKMMADEAEGELPDIGAMLLPLKAVAEDLTDSALSNNKLLSRSFNMKQIGSKLQALTSKAMKSLTSDDLDQWA